MRGDVLLRYPLCSDIIVLIDTLSNATPINIMKSRHSGKKFIEILYEENFLLIGFSFLIAHSSSQLLASLIHGLLMPIIVSITDEASWESATTTIGGVKLNWGEPLADLIHFAVVVVFSVYAYKLLKKGSPDDTQ